MSGEAKIAGAVMDWLQCQGWDCYPEVQLYYGGARADIVGVRSGLVLICEVKTSMGLALLSQAIGWHGSAHFICVATPARKSGAQSRAGRHLMDYYGLGHIEVAPSTWGPKDVVSEKIRPRYKRPSPPRLKRILAGLHPDMKRYSPGTQAGYSTPWKRTMDRAVAFVEQHPGCTIRELIDGVETHYASPGSARACVKNWLGEDERCRVDTGVKPFRYYPVHEQGGEGVGDAK